MSPQNTSRTRSPFLRRLHAPFPPPERLDPRIAPATIIGPMDGTIGFTFAGEHYEDGLGAAASIVGDINGDGFADMILGYPSAGDDSSGAVHVLLGIKHKHL